MTGTRLASRLLGDSAKVTADALLGCVKILVGVAEAAISTALSDDVV